MFRTVPARWFEQLIAKPMLARAMEVLAATESVEFEFADSTDPALSLSTLRNMLEPWTLLLRRYANFLPHPKAPTNPPVERLETAIERNVSAMRRWESEAAPLVDSLEKLSQESWQLVDIADFLELVSEAQLDIGALQKATPELQARLFVLPSEAPTPPAAEAILHMRVANEDKVFLLTLGEPLATGEAERLLSGVEGRSLDIPDELSGSVVDALMTVAERTKRVEAEIAERQARLDEISLKYDIARVLGEMLRLEWLVGHLEGVPVGEYFAHLTGWTSDPDGHALREALEEADLSAVVHLSRPPRNLVPPTLIRNPGWIKPFEFFGKLMGTPGTTEAEPSVLIAVIAPLLFGYMFGDVGHGLVILVLGLALHKRWPASGMLISGGIVSIIFGVLYGSIFTVEGVLPALWVNPLEEPLEILFLPMLGGALLILLGMILNGLGHLWEGRIGYWLLCEAGIMLAYVGIAASIFDSRFLPAVFLGVAWHIAGNTWDERADGIAALAGALGDLFEYALQLAVNTVSFVRVGAFALAHAGLGATVASLADSAELGISAALILLVGNLAIIGLEGLVVSVQTTRLLLFEFFIRFMRASGRQFCPVLPPQYEMEEKQ